MQLNHKMTSSSFHLGNPESNTHGKIDKHNLYVASVVAVGEGGV